MQLQLSIFPLKVHSGTSDCFSSLFQKFRVPIRNKIALLSSHNSCKIDGKSDFEQRIKLISSKLYERKIEGGIRLAASNDKIAPFSTVNSQKLLPKYPQRAKFSASNLDGSDCFL